MIMMWYRKGDNITNKLPMGKGNRLIMRDDKRNGNKTNTHTTVHTRVGTNKWGVGENKILTRVTRLNKTDKNGVGGIVYQTSSKVSGTEIGIAVKVSGRSL